MQLRVVRPKWDCFCYLELAPSHCHGSTTSPFGIDNSAILTLVGQVCAQSVVHREVRVFYDLLFLSLCIHQQSGGQDLAYNLAFKFRSAVCYILATLLLPWIKLCRESRNLGFLLHVQEFLTCIDVSLRFLKLLGTIYSVRLCWTYQKNTNMSKVISFSSKLPWSPKLTVGLLHYIPFHFFNYNPLVVSENLESGSQVCQIQTQMHWYHIVIVCSSRAFSQSSSLQPGFNT